MKMKNKKEEQNAQRKKRKEEQKTQKRKKQPNFELPEPTKKERQSILIVSEGKHTEPDYFNYFKRHFRLSSVKIECIGDAGNTIQVVERAEKGQKVR